MIFHYLFLTIFFFANQFLRKIDGNHACNLFDSLIICGNFFHSCLTLHYYATNCSDVSGNQNLVSGLGVVMRWHELVKQDFSSFLAVLTVVASLNLKIYVIHFWPKISKFDHELHFLPIAEKWGKIWNSPGFL